MVARQSGGFIGDAPVARYQDALRLLLAAPEVDGVFMHAPTGCWLARYEVAGLYPACNAAVLLALMEFAGSPLILDAGFIRPGIQV